MGKMNDNCNVIKSKLFQVLFLGRGGREGCMYTGWIGGMDGVRVTARVSFRYRLSRFTLVLTLAAKFLLYSISYTIELFLEKELDFSHYFPTQTPQYY